MQRKHAIPSDVELEWISIDDVKPWDRNPKDHDVGLIITSLRTYGYVRPATVNRATGKLLLGHGLIEALRQMKANGDDPPRRVRAQNGTWTIPVVMTDLESPLHEPYVIIDNRSTELGGWDEGLLPSILLDLAKEDRLDITGFDEHDLSEMLARLEDPEPKGRTDEPDLDPTLRVICADVIDGLRELEADSVQCVVTSPPYWALRDYGTGSWSGGDPDCDHRLYAYPDDRETPGGRKGSMPKSETVQRKTCRKCGAVREDRQLGLEETPDEYIARMVEIFREVRRVLRPDGIAWINLGDSYASSVGGGQNDLSTSTVTGSRKKRDPKNETGIKRSAGLKPKDLVGIPWRVALALQADGWYLRSDVIWSKPNPMPESVTDRPTKAHEYVFMLTKSERYFFDADAVAEESVDQESLTGRHRRNPDKFARHDPNGFAMTRAGFANIPDGKMYPTRNIRTVWTIATEPYPEAHFAVFPTAIPDRCIRAATSDAGSCSVCGAPFAKEIDRVAQPPKDWNRKGDGDPKLATRPRGKNGQTHAEWKATHPDTFRGWHPTCEHENADAVPCTVLDPFAGSGTTLAVALELRRHAIGIELNPDFVPLIKRRCASVEPGRRLREDET